MQEQTAANPEQSFPADHGPEGPPVGVQPEAAAALRGLPLHFWHQFLRSALSQALPWFHLPAMAQSGQISLWRAYVLHGPAADRHEQAVGPVQANLCEG